MIYLNKDDVGKNVYRVTQDYVVELSYFVKAKNADEARDIVLDNGGFNTDSFRELIREDSDQLELDFYDVGFDGQSQHMLGKVVVDTLDQDEVELDKYATEGVI
jgi:hypothetical protein